MKRYRIANLNIDMTCSGRTAAQAEAYASACPGAPDITIHVDGGAVLSAHPELRTADMAEYLASGERFAVGLLAHQGVMLHASAVELDGRCVCFSAPPGVGKSTLARRWERLFGAQVLNDDKPALRRLETGWQVFGTPWSGKTDKSIRRAAPLHAICFLFRGEENALTPLPPAEALPLFMSQTIFQLGRADLERLMALADRLLQEVSVCRLTCRNDDSAAQFTKTALFDL